MTLIKIYQFLSWLILFLYLGLIFYLSSMPSIPVPEAFPQQDKVFHFLAYLVVGLLARNAFFTKGLRLGAVPFLFAVLYGISDEFHQSFVPGREVSVLDWFADSLGSGVGVFVIFPFLRTQIRNLPYLEILQTIYK